MEALGAIRLNRCKMAHEIIDFVSSRSVVELLLIFFFALIFIVVGLIYPATGIVQKWASDRQIVLVLHPWIDRLKPRFRKREEIDALGHFGCFSLICVIISFFMLGATWGLALSAWFVFFVYGHWCSVHESGESST